MTISGNLRLVDRFYNDMWNRFDKTGFPEILHDTVSFRGSLGQVKRRFKELGDYVDFIEAAFPDFHNEVVETITEDNKTFRKVVVYRNPQGRVVRHTPHGETDSVLRGSCLYDTGGQDL